MDELDLELAAIDRTQLARDVVGALVASGAVADPTRLANLAFHIHHPDRDLAKRIDPAREPALAAQWKQLHAKVVTPALASVRSVMTGARKILLVGDSHTTGPFGKELERLLVESGAVVERHAKIGSWVQYWLPKIADLVRAHAPTEVVIALGANMRHGYPDDGGRGRANQVRKLLAAIRSASPNVRIVWIGPPRERGDTDATLDRDAGIVRAGLDANVTFIDSGPHTPAFRGAADGVHYDAPTAKQWARGVFSQLR